MKTLFGSPKSALTHSSHRYLSALFPDPSLRPNRLRSIPSALHSFPFPSFSPWPGRLHFPLSSVLSLFHSFYYSRSPLARSMISFPPSLMIDNVLLPCMNSPQYFLNSSSLVYRNTARIGGEVIVTTDTDDTSNIRIYGNVVVWTWGLRSSVYIEYK